MTKTKEKNISFQIINHVHFIFAEFQNIPKYFLTHTQCFITEDDTFFYVGDEHETIYNENTNIIVSQWTSDALRAIWSYHFEKKI